MRGQLARLGMGGLVSEAAAAGRELGQPAGLRMGRLLREAAGRKAAGWVGNGLVVERGSCCG